MSTILLVDDDAFFRDRLVRAFVKRGFDVHDAGSYDEAIPVIKDVRPQLAVIDLKMPGKSGLELITAARAIVPEILIIVLTGYGSIATATEAVRRGALYYLPKPAAVDDILNAFARDSSSPEDIEPSEFTPPSLARVEWEHIQRVLADCDGNITAAAKKLGLHRRTLQRKLYKYAPR